MLRRAIELNPRYATAHHWYTEFFRITDRLDEALAEIKKARELDPLSLIIHTVNIEILLNLGRHDEAMELSHEALKIGPNFGGGLNAVA